MLRGLTKNEEDDVVGCTASVCGYGVWAGEPAGCKHQRHWRFRSRDSRGYRALVSYRYLLTPRSGLELNYGFTQNSPVYTIPGTLKNTVHARQQEISAAYVFSMTFKRYSPFLEAGPGVMFFSPIHDFGSNILDTKRTTTIGGVFGGGVAYELSPSFDIRAEYRGFVGKTPNFGIDDFSTNRYRVISSPSIGVAYHF